MEEDLTKTVKAHLYERISSPLLGSFIISWCLWNYRFILVMLSDEKPADKVKLVTELVFPTVVDVWLNGFSLPVVTSFLFIFAYPWPARLVYWYSKNQQKALKKIKQSIEDDTPVTQDEFLKLRKKLMSAEAELSYEIMRRDDEIKVLKSSLKDAVDSHEKYVIDCDRREQRRLDIIKSLAATTTDKIQIQGASVAPNSTPMLDLLKAALLSMGIVEKHDYSMADENFLLKLQFVKRDIGLAQPMTHTYEYRTDNGRTEQSEFRRIFESEIRQLANQYLEKGIA